MEFRKPTFYGSVTVSDRGQVVIPAKARKELDIQEGEKLLVFKSPLHGVVFLKSDVLTERVANLKSIFDGLSEHKGHNTKNTGGTE